MHTDHGNGNDRPFQIGSRCLAYDTQYRFDWRIFSGMYSRRETNLGAWSASVNDDDGNSDRASHRLADLYKALGHLARLSRDLAHLDCLALHHFSGSSVITLWLQDTANKLLFTQYRQC